MMMWNGYLLSRLVRGMMLASHKVKRSIMKPIEMEKMISMELI